MSHEQNDRILDYIVEQYLEDCDSMSPQEAYYNYLMRRDTEFNCEYDRVKEEGRF